LGTRPRLRAALVAVLLASLGLGAHVSAGPAAATPPTPTAVYIYNPPSTWVVNQQMTVQTWVSATVDGGTIELRIDGTSYDTKPVAQAGWTEFVWTPDTKKAYTLQVFYSGTSSFAASESAVASITVIAPYPNSPTVTGTPNPVQRNQDIDLTATVTPIPGTGNIEWRNSDNEVIGTTPVGVDGKSTLATSFDTAGVVGIWAKWMGNDNYSPRAMDSPYHLTVLGDSIVLDVSVPGAPLPPGDVVASVTLTPNPGTGVLQWRPCEYCADAGEVAVDPSGTTSIDLGTLSVNSYALWVRYPPTGDWAEANGHTFFSVWNATSTTIATDRSTAYVGELPVKLTGTVAGLTYPAGGTITFLDDVGGSVVQLGPVAIDPYGFTATFSSNSLRVGTHSITARYDGSDGWLASTSSPVVVVVAADSSVHATFAPSLSKFYPHNDGFKDKVKLGGVLSERASVTIRVYNSGGTLKRSWSLGTRNAGSYSATWNGKTSGGTALPAGTYTAKATIKDTHGHSRTLSGKTTISWRQVTWKSVSVLRYANSGSYYVGDFGGWLYLSPDYPKGIILDSGEMLRDCEDCGFAAGELVFTVRSTDVLALRKLYIEMRGHDFSDREHPGSHGLIDPRTGHLALINGNYPVDDPNVHWGIPFTSGYIDSSHHVHAWIWMDQAWGDAYDLAWLRLTYQYAVWK
jgi:hypothetical protein